MKEFILCVSCCILWCQISLSQSLLPQSSEPPIIPIGEQAYIDWDKLPYHRIGIRGYMRSTYDRTGNNESADASNFLYQESETMNTVLDLKGNGILYFARTNHWHGSPWNYEIDSNGLFVKETGTSDPINAIDRFKDTEFIPETLFPYPLVWTWTKTKGADLMWRPVPFDNSFRLSYGRTFYGTGYFIYHLFPRHIDHVQPRTSSLKMNAPKKEVLDLINESGTDIAPKGNGVAQYSGNLSLKPFESKTFFESKDAPSMIRAVKFILPKEKALDFGNCRIKVTWDNRLYPSIDAPIDLFFGTGELYNNNGREYLVKGFPLSIKYEEDTVHLSCYWPMPYFQNAKFEITERNGQSMEDIKWEIRTVPYLDPINHVSYFHATYTDHEFPEEGKDLTFLDTKQVEGGGEWSGHFVGMSWIFTEDGELKTLEGDPRFYFDDSQTPQAWGTGTEEWGGGGDYWGGENMTIPFAGHPIGQDAKSAKNNLEKINSAYRFLVADFFPFGKRAIINLEHGGQNTYSEHYSGVTYWYGIDAPSLVLTDELNVFNEEDSRRHNYMSPTASLPYSLVSRYEWGPDTDSPNFGNPPDMKEDYYSSRLFFPAQQDSVRSMTGVSQFTVSLDPDNLGVLLRRKFDYLYPNQKANVYVKDENTTEWELAGEWYTAGSNTCVFSFPEGELDQAQHQMITSNRRWREEEFLIGRELTEGIEKLDIKIEHIPNSIQLFPGKDFPAESRWSESRYWVYCYSMPRIHSKISNGAFSPGRKLESGLK
ncbi:DUF2961 domain-containing protein [Confluentibacter flavum]|uniref:DUF2961 domain-containing protein n=1 Tax=Confluentibacter flavum TaxID=1909700 RepID=A0A2N3HHN0_9FLAO|nr:DUF2961 domain-containing protein [Confluentibacter flavum]PKQ44413.1 hypothetical protein CSW08_13460 [Confluentibacter flavum]